MLYALIVLILIIIITFLIYYLGEGKCDLRRAKKEFKIFGLGSGFTPQGINHCKYLNSFLMSGYMKNKKLASRIYVIDYETKNLIKYITLNKNGKDIISHFGGITSFGEDVWISTDKKVLRIKANDIKNAKNGESVRIFDDFSPENEASFCFVNAGYLWVGEFYRLSNFKTDISHHLRIDENNQFHAMCYGFKISPKSSGGVESFLPEKALCIPDKTQGIAISKNQIYVSISYGISRSNLLVYKNVFSSPAQTYTYIGGKKIPLYVLMNGALEQKLTLPSMSEEIEVFDNKLFVLFESAAKKYRIFTRRKTFYVYSFLMNKKN